MLIFVVIQWLNIGFCFCASLVLIFKWWWYWSLSLRNNNWAQNVWNFSWSYVICEVFVVMVRLATNKKKSACSIFRRSTLARNYSSSWASSHLAQAEVIFVLIFAELFSRVIIFFFWFILIVRYSFMLT